MQLRIKICGITNLEDALGAVEAGADALGFMFCEASARYVSAKTAADIIGQLPPLVSKVGVFVDAPEDLVRQTIAESGIDTLQFHGSESPEYCGHFTQATIKAVRLQGIASVQALAQYRTRAWLVDSYVPGKAGGTGTQCDWGLALEAKRLGRPIILAGGLTPENIGEAIRCVRPFGVDVSSGVEAAPGRKDPRKLRRFVQEARAAAQT